MNTKDKLLRLCDEGGTCVLVVTVTLPVCDSQYIESFYGDISDSFEMRARTELLRDALLAYESSTDRRKRYRYTPKKAVFLCRPCGEHEYELIFGYNGEIFLRERHLWHGNVIVKRKRCTKG